MLNLLYNNGFKKNIFFAYLVYISTILTAAFFSWQFNFFSIAFHYDESYFTLLITFLYIVFESVCGIRIYKLTKSIDETKKYFTHMSKIKNLSIAKENENVFYLDGFIKYEIKQKELKQHVIDLLDKKNNQTVNLKLNNKVLLQNVSDDLENKHNIAYVFTEILIWLGLIGTILGIILTFLPFISGQVTIDGNNVQQTLALLFKGVGSAFFPSIAAAIASLLLKGSDYLLLEGSNELITNISKGSDIIISPVIENS
jgi:biopolymer transport protein ExbB/TolQ